VRSARGSGFVLAQNGAPGFFMRDHVSAVGGIEATRDFGEEIQTVHRILDRRIFWQMLKSVAEQLLGSN